MLTRRGFLGGIAAALAASRLPKLPPLKRPKSVTAINVTSWDALMKQLYPAEAVGAMVMTAHPLLSMLKRDTDEGYYEAYTVDR